MNAPPPIGVVRGLQTGEAQSLFEHVLALHGTSLRVVGVIEENGPVPARGKAGYLRTLPDGRRFDLFQDLGSGAAGCSLLAAGVVAAGAHVLAAMARPCDLVVLNKFGRLEAEEGTGLIDVFGAAMLAGIPVLTSVNPKFLGAWDRFAAPLYAVLPPHEAAIGDWLRAVTAKEGARP